MKTISVSENNFERFKLAKIAIQAKKQQELTDDAAMSEILSDWKENFKEA